jgi:hypothetical protein
LTIRPQSWAQTTRVTSIAPVDVSTATSMNIAT